VLKEGVKERIFLNTIVDIEILSSYSINSGPLAIIMFCQIYQWEIR